MSQHAVSAAIIQKSAEEIFSTKNKTVTNNGSYGTFIWVTTQILNLGWFMYTV
jgi:hypothetical protein